MSYFVIKIGVSCQEYQSEYVLNKFKKAKKRKAKKIFAIIFFIVFLIFSSVLIFLEKVVNPIVFSYGEAQINQILTKASNSAINELTAINYDEFVDITYSTSGDVLAIKANTSEINKIGNMLALYTQSKIDEATVTGVNIPLGTLSGIAFLTGVGNDVKFKINPIGDAKCEFYTSFSSCGINQTSHKIFVTIESKASLILPFGTKQIENKSSYIVSEFVIVGKVPNTYLNVTSLNDLK